MRNSCELIERGTESKLCLDGTGWQFEVRFVDLGLDRSRPEER